MQGYGLFVLEQFQHTPNGVPLTVGPSTYKIPGFGYVPEEFNVSLLSGLFFFLLCFISSSNYFRDN